MSDPETIAAIVAFTWTLLSLIVALTPTPIDDQCLTLLRALVERLSYLHPKNSPGVLSVPGAPAVRPYPPYDPAAEEARAHEEGTP